MKIMRLSHDILPAIVGDNEMLVELFQNLISNSIKYHGDDQPEIHVSVKGENDHYWFSIKDNGIGISSDHLERIYNFSITSW